MVANVHLPIVWDNEALKQLKEAYEKILEDSYQGAVKVRNDIFDAVERIAEHPYRYPADKFKKNNLGNYRAFKKLSDAEKKQVIEQLHQTWTDPDNEVRNRIKLFAVRSPEILKPILES